MRLICKHILLVVIVINFGLCLPFAQGSQIQWHKNYDLGLKAMENGDWKLAIKHFHEAIRKKPTDTDKIRAYGTIFIAYYPNREMGICLYNLGKMGLAKGKLQKSLRQSYSLRAKTYLDKIGDAVVASDDEETPSLQTDDLTLDQPSTPPPPPTPIEEEVETSTTQVGERLRIAILPFENKGQSINIDLLDKLITVCVKMDRFKVLERAQLMRVIEEQKLGMSGFIDAATAAEIGKGVGVDAVVTGSITWASTDISIDARFVDTETAAIISAQDAYAQGRDLKSLNDMLEELALKFKNDFPIVNGYVIGVDSEKLTLDLGRNKGIRKGMKCYVYREGAPIIHPVSKKVIGKMIDVLSEIQLRDVYEQYSLGYVIKPRTGTPGIGDMVITK